MEVRGGARGQACVTGPERRPAARPERRLAKWLQNDEICARILSDGMMLFPLKTLPRG